MTAATASRQPALKKYPLPRQLSGFVGGKWVAPAGGGADIPVIDPATEETLMTFPEATAKDVERAVAAAQEAFDNGPWPRMNVAERKRIFSRVCELIHRHADELAYLDCVDTGVAYNDIRTRKIGRLADNFEFYGEVISLAAGETYQQSNAYFTFVTRHPVGVAALLAPWNSPLSLASMQLAPCIAFGNTCILKPSEQTPLGLARLVELIHEAGVPPGVVNLVNGRGPVTGQSLTSHPAVRRIKFTGGTATGRAIMAAAAQNLTPVSLELGGKSANIICESADLDAALDGALVGIFSNNGQQCLAGSRILVQTSVANAFIDKFVKRAEKIRIGDPFDPATELGPICFKEHMERVLSYVDIAKREGAELLTGGKRAAKFDKGYYIEPTAVLARSNSARVSREEIFGPFATLLTFDTFEEAVKIANDSEFGLVAYIWTEDLRTALKASRDLMAGTVWVNTPLLRDLRAPFGGYKHSGIGRDSAHSLMDFFTEAKATLAPYERADMVKLGWNG